MNALISNPKFIKFLITIINYLVVVWQIDKIKPLINFITQYSESQSVSSK
jgi:hypothetical protein